VGIETGLVVSKSGVVGEGSDGGFIVEALRRRGILCGRVPVWMVNPVAFSDFFLELVKLFILEEKVGFFLGNELVWRLLVESWGEELTLFMGVIDGSRSCSGKERLRD
jgi:hypothetical protein